MSKKHRNFSDEVATEGDRLYALLFTALGDETRLLLVARLSEGGALSIAQLTGISTMPRQMTRQAISKHLHVLMVAGLVRSTRLGRKHLYEFNPEPFRDAHDYLARVSKQWDQALGRLQSFVEESP